MNKLTLISISIALASGLLATDLLADEFTANSTTPASLSNTVATQQEKAPMPSAKEHNTLGTISEITASESNFATLVAALNATQLDKLLDSKGPYTIFAPSDAAFEALPAGTMTRLLKPAKKDELKAILSYHVVEGNLTKADLTNQKVKMVTLEGSTLNIKSSDYGITINDANMITSDIQASNGTIHIIDTVLMPQNVKSTTKNSRKK